MFSAPVVERGIDRRPAWWVFGQLAQCLGTNILEGLDVESCTEIEVLEKYRAIGRYPVADVMASGTHGLAAPLLHGWVRERVLDHGRWRLAPEPLVNRLDSLWEGLG